MDKPNDFLGDMDNDGTRPGMCMGHEKLGNKFGDKARGRGHDEWWRKVGGGCHRLSNSRYVTLHRVRTKQRTSSSAPTQQLPRSIISRPRPPGLGHEPSATAIDQPPLSPAFNRANNA